MKIYKYFRGVQAIHATLRACDHISKTASRTHSQHLDGNHHLRSLTLILQNRIRALNQGRNSNASLTSDTTYKIHLGYLVPVAPNGTQMFS